MQIGIKNPSTWANLVISHGADIKASRALNTAYQAATNLKVIVYVSRVGDSNVIIGVGTTSACTDAYTDTAFLTATNTACVLSGWVPAGWYYKVTAAAGTISGWWEIA